MSEGNFEAQLLDRIRQLETERDQWQESCGKNYLRAQDDYLRAQAAEMREEKLEMRVRELESRPCPHVVSSDEGTQYCRLGEERIRELEAERDDLDKTCRLFAARSQGLEEQLRESCAESRQLRDDEGHGDG